jgi:hypothetical protein
MSESVEAMMARIALLEAALAEKNARPLTMKVSDKGGVSVYGLGRFPVTLYAGQWDRLLADAERVRAFVDANRSILAVKE